MLLYNKISAKIFTVNTSVKLSAMLHSFKVHKAQVGLVLNLEVTCSHFKRNLRNNYIFNIYCRGSCIRLYVAKLKVVCLTLDTWWSLLTPVVCQIIKYVYRPNMAPKTYKADSQFEKLCRKTVVLPACS